MKKVVTLMLVLGLVSVVSAVPSVVNLTLSTTDAHLLVAPGTVISVDFSIDQDVKIITETTGIDFTATGASNALAAIGTPEATQVLLDAARDAQETDHRERILFACRWLKNKDSVQLLEKALDDMSSASVRAAAANALANFENEPIAVHLARAYERETDPRVKEAITDAIQRLGARSM